jgi:sigma-B regulation protein RsbU (phosphoserine phosphatase)
MAVTRSLFRNISTHTAKPSRIVTALNESLSEGNDANMFVTLFVGVLDLPTGRLHYCNAGHDAPWMIPAPGTGNCVELAVESNLPLGVMPGWTFQEQVTMMPRGTTIFLYTDGLNEAENATHQQFGVERIQAVLEAPNPSGTPSTPQAFINIMTDAVHQFVGDTEQSDDLTMLAVLYQPEKLEEKLQRSLTLSNNVQEVPQLAMFVDEVCEALDFDMPTTMQMNLAIEEAVVNVMNYAYPPDTQGEVRITAVANDERLKFVISDDGIPFDPTAKEEADITLSAEERKIGGLGIHLVRQIMDSINYERVGNQNVFTLRKKLQQS